MGTRAVITFKDEHDTFCVYQHWDGDPNTITENILAAQEYAWPLPRFEAAEFAAAYIAATKKKGGGDNQGGNIYFARGAKFHCDLSYNYVVTEKDGKLNIEAYRGNGKAKV